MQILQDEHEQQEVVSMFKELPPLSKFVEMSCFSREANIIVIQDWSREIVAAYFTGYCIL